MVHYKMKLFGSCDGKVSKKSYRFNKDQIIEAKEGEFDEYFAEMIEVKKDVKVSGKKVETAAKNIKAEKR